MMGSSMAPYQSGPAVDAGTTPSPIIYDPSVCDSYNETFDDRANVTLDGDVILRDGIATVHLPVHIEDDFNRSDLGAWQLASGTANVSSGRLYINSSQYSHSLVNRSIDLFGIRLECRVKITSDVGRGPRILLETAQMNYGFDISWDEGELRIFVEDSYQDSLKLRRRVTLLIDEWYDVTVEATFDNFHFVFGNYKVSTTIYRRDRYANFTGVGLGFSDGCNGYYDDVLVMERKNAQGNVTSAPVALPPDSLWEDLVLHSGNNSDGYFQVGIIDAVTSEFVPGYDLPYRWEQVNVRRQVFDIDGVHFSDHPVIRIVIVIETRQWGFPKLDGFTVTWKKGGSIWMDAFDNGDRLARTDGCMLQGGKLGLDPTVWKDRFNRTSLHPWTFSTSSMDASVVLTDGMVRYNGGSSKENLTVLERSILMRDLALEFRLNITNASGQGFNLSFVTGSGRSMHLAWNGDDGRFALLAWDGSRWTTVHGWDGEPVTEEWIDIRLSFTRHSGLYCLWNGGGRFGKGVDFYEPFTRVTFSWGGGDEGYIDDVVLRNIYAEESATSVDVPLPQNMTWHVMRRSISEFVYVDILDGITQETIPGYTNITSTLLNLTGIDPARHPSLMLRARFLSYYVFAYANPSLDWWQLGWRPLDTEHLEPFDDDLAIDVTQGLMVTDGHLMTRNRLIWDEFKRVLVEPWEVLSGVPEIQEGRLCTQAFNGGSSEVRMKFRPVDAATFNTFLFPKVLDNGKLGFVFKSFTDGGFFSLIYYHENRTLILSGDDGSNSILGGVRTFQINETTWSHVEIAFDEGQVNATINGESLYMYGEGFERFDAVEVFCTQGNVVLWEFITLVTPLEEGHGITDVVPIPQGEGWLFLEMADSSVLGSDMMFSILDAETLRPFPGFENLTSDLVELALPVDVDEVRLRFDMVGKNESIASIDWYRIYWANALGEVIQKKEFETIMMTEDVPLRNVLDLRDHFAARDVDPSDLKFKIAHVSDPLLISPYLEGSILSINLPTENGFGNAKFRIECIYWGSSLDSGDIRVVIEPVDDPPVLLELDDLHLVEDEEGLLDLSPHVHDVDTPIQDLRVVVDLDQCTVDRLILTFLFTDGEFHEGILVHVFDGTSTVYQMLMLHVEGVDDTPVIDDLPVINMVEDVLQTIDLTTFIHDEDTPPSHLTLICEGEGVMSVDGLALNLLYPEGGERLLDIFVSDTTTLVSAHLMIVVEEVNEPPIIDGIGDLKPPIAIVLGEGEAIVLEIRAHDEEDQTLTFLIDTEWPRMWLSKEGRLHISSEKGRLGTFNGTLVVKDGDGASTSLGIVVHVVLVNEPPFIPQIIEPMNHSVWNEGALIQFNVSVFDPDMVTGQLLTITWSSNVSGVMKSYTTLDASQFAIGSLSVGRHRITVEANDGEFTRTSWMELEVVAIDDIPPEPDPGSNDPSPLDPFPYVLLIIAIAIILSVVILVGRRRRGQ
jgi:hypothetical protein